MNQKSPVEILREAAAEAAYELDQAESALESHREEQTKKHNELHAAVEAAIARVDDFDRAYLRVGGEPGKFKGTGPDGQEFDFVIGALKETGGNNGETTTKKARSKARSAKSRV